MGLAFLALLATASCSEPPESSASNDGDAISPQEETGIASPRPEIYAEFGLTADVSDLSTNQQQVLRLLVRASEINGRSFLAPSLRR